MSRPRKKSEKKPEPTKAEPTKTQPDAKPKTEPKPKHTATVVPVGDLHQASCSCGWKGNERSTVEKAQHEGDLHLKEVGDGA